MCTVLKFDLVYYGNYFDYLKNWNNVIGSEKDVTILPIYYENFKQVRPWTFYIHK